MKNRLINIIFLLFFAVCFFPSFTYGQANDTTIYLIPDVYPEFKYQECKTSYEACERYFKLNYKMPLALTDNGYSGIIIVRLVVEKDGKLSNVKIIRGMNDSLDESILEFVRKMPMWIPGLKKRKIVRTETYISARVNWLYGNNE